LVIQSGCSELVGTSAAPLPAEQRGQYDCAGEAAGELWEVPAGRIVLTTVQTCSQSPGTWRHQELSTRYGTVMAACQDTVTTLFAPGWRPCVRKSGSTVCSQQSTSCKDSTAAVVARHSAAAGFRHPYCHTLTGLHRQQTAGRDKPADQF